MNIQFKFSIWLIETLLNKACNFSELQCKWQSSSCNSEGKELSERSFNRYRRCAEELFQVGICCNRSNENRYEIEDRDAILSNKLLSWQLMSFRMDQLAKEIKNKEVVVLDAEAPASHYLEPVLKAIEGNLCLDVVYKSHYKEAKSVRFMPSFVRLWGQRWYMVGMDLDQGMHRVYAFERISELTLGPVLTKADLGAQAKIDPSSYFYSSFGVITEGEPTFVKLRAYWPQNAYLKDVPLHHSQQVLEECTDYTDFELYVKPTYDFIQAILGQREQVQVLEPEFLRSEIKAVLQGMMSFY
ncbi:WYL domain-containing protein [Sphingobacterium kyonggiense]